MRELKFRVWDKRYNHFTKPETYDYLCYAIKSDGELLHVAIKDICRKAEQEELLIQQFTGLKDKNGREIYEGDLVNFYIPGQAHGPEREDFKNEEVWWDIDSAGFVFGKSYYDGWHGLHPYEIKDIEIVGNIFENPELIKK